MSGYAARLDGEGWRAVNVPDDCADDEYFTKEQPALAPFIPSPPEKGGAK